MASYTTEVGVIHKKFQTAVKRARTKKALNKTVCIKKIMSAY